MNLWSPLFDVGMYSPLRSILNLYFVFRIFLSPGMSIKKNSSQPNMLQSEKEKVINKILISPHILFIVE